MKSRLQVKDKYENLSKMENPTKVKFFFIKGNYYRVIHVDGAHGGITPRGKIFAALYNERAPIPQTTVHGVTGMSLGPELPEGRTGKDGIIREVEVGIVMDVGTATAFHKWLGEKIDDLKKIVAKSPGEQEKDAHIL